MLRVRSHPRSLIALAIAASLAPLTAQAMSIDKMLTINVFQLCDDAGANCASLGPIGNSYFAAETNKIWAQAGILVNFNFVQQINSTKFSFTDDQVAGDGFADLAALYGTHGQSATGVDMFLVHKATDGADEVYGEGWFGFGGLIMSMDLVMGYPPAGRIDTIAHELGHNFGLVPDSLGGIDSHSPLPNANYLMASGSDRTVPADITGITTDGVTGLDILPADQIAYARKSTLLSPVPEPETYALMLAGLGVLGFLAHRRGRV